MKLIKRKKYSAFDPNNRARLVHSGEDFFNTLAALIRSAEQVLHFQVYIFSEDETGAMIKNELTNAATRGVKVFLMCDGYATEFSERWIKDLRSAGIHFRYFEPFFSSRNFYFGRRLHHKVMVADRKCALVGGLNISNRYNAINGKAPWLDFALYNEGEVCIKLHNICEDIWSGKKIKVVVQTEKKNILYPQMQEDHLVPVRARTNDWVRRRIDIMKTYVEMLHRAEKEITIVCSYFLPSRLFRFRMRRAARRGIRVRVVLAGISDVKLSKYAERYLYGWMLRNNIEIYEYSKSVLHAKLATCDRKWMTIGSYNVNNLSASASIELNLDVKDEQFTRDVNAVIEQIILNDCERITMEDYKRKFGFFSWLAQWSSYTIARFLLFIFTNNLKQETARET